MPDHNNKILLLVPALTARGGITNYYQVLRKHLPENIEYFERGARTWPVRKGAISELLRAWKDLGNFKEAIRKQEFALVQSSTSLGFASVIRDGLFLLVARRKGLKTIVFFRGWDAGAQYRMQLRYQGLFRKLFFKCDSIIVLSENVKNLIKTWGYKGPVFLETTLVDKEILTGLTLEKIREKYINAGRNKSFNILFLSRIEQKKGVFELLQAFRDLNNELGSEYTLTLNICGDGSELENVKKMVAGYSLHNINVQGFVDGKQKQNAFNGAHVFVFPSHSEGMPNAVLEAMGFGLPVITTPVGGLIDIFTDSKNGYFINKNNPDQIKKQIMGLITNPERLLEISAENFTYAASKFSSDKVALRMCAIFEKTLIE